MEIEHDPETCEDYKCRQRRCVYASFRTVGLNPQKANKDRAVSEAADSDKRLIPYRPGTHG